MYVEEDNYEYFKNEKVNNLSKLNYDFILNKRFIDVKDNNDEYFQCQTPFMRVLKPNHITLNRKKTIANKYIILEINDELDFNNQIGDFLYIINKIHEISQEKIKNNSMKWFKTEFDEIGLDIKVRRPINEQKENEFIKICIPKNKELEDKIDLLSKGDYILCNIVFKGLKVSNDYINEEWELTDFITQEKYDEMQNSELFSIQNNELMTSILEEELNNIESVVKDNELMTLEETNNIQPVVKDNELMTLEEETNNIQPVVKDNELITVEETNNIESVVKDNELITVEEETNNIESVIKDNELITVEEKRYTEVENTNIFIEKNEMKDIENNSVQMNSTLLSETNTFKETSKNTSNSKFKKHKIIKREKKILYM